KADEYLDKSDFGFLSTPNIKNDEIAFDKAYYITKYRYDESPEIMLEQMDVLLVKDGSTLGISNIVKYLPFKCTVNSSIAVLRIFNRKIINPYFLNYVLKSEYIQRIISNMKGGMGVPHLFQSDIKNFEFFIPPISEQEQIVLYLQEQTSKIDKAIAQRREQIVRLKEYKQSLINEAVTGKIKIIA
ncbi:restriction endonuclease subunit S, partial [Sphingobacterium siyangense]|uniref:restriction endonuclease subunit S n=1 Tax=Sphingobacterium siyangense TaxID=459529 RepID=UPI003DA35540